MQRIRRERGKWMRRHGKSLPHNLLHLSSVQNSVTRKTVFCFRRETVLRTGLLGEILIFYFPPPSNYQRTNNRP